MTRASQRLFTRLGRAAGSTLVLGALLVSALQGQTSDAQQRMPPTAADFRVGQFVRLTAPGIVIDGGTIQSISGDTLLVAGQGVQWSVQASLLEAISVRESRTGTYAVRGFFPGALLGVLGAVLVSKMNCGSRGTDCPPIRYGKGALIGGALGTAMGVLAGTSTTHWRQVFP